MEASASGFRVPGRDGDDYDYDIADDFDSDVDDVDTDDDFYDDGCCCCCFRAAVARTTTPIWTTASTVRCFVFSYGAIPVCFSASLSMT